MNNVNDYLPENFLHCFPALHRAVEVSVISGLYIKPFKSHNDISNDTIFGNLHACRIRHRLSMEGDILVSVDNPGFSELRNNRNVIDLDKFWEDLDNLANNYTAPSKIHSPGAFDALLRTAYERLDFSIYDYKIVLQIAQAIAYLDKSDQIKTEHLAEAIHYRTIRPNTEADLSVTYGDYTPVMLP
jgi:hypothetical protein